MLKVQVHQGGNLGTFVVHIFKSGKSTVCACVCLISVIVSRVLLPFLKIMCNVMAMHDHFHDNGGWGSAMMHSKIYLLPIFNPGRSGNKGKPLREACHCFVFIFSSVAKLKLKHKFERKQIVFFRITRPMLYQLSHDGEHSPVHFVGYFCTFNPWEC